MRIARSNLAQVQRIEVCVVDGHIVTVKVVALLGGATLVRTACAVVPGQEQDRYARTRWRLVNFLLLVSACGALIAVAIAWLLWRGDF